MISKLAYVDHSHVVSGSQVMQNRGLVQIGHVGHVFNLLKLGWIHLLDIILLYCTILLRQFKIVETSIIYWYFLTF